MSKHLVPWLLPLCVLLGMALRPADPHGNPAQGLSDGFERVAREASPAVLQIQSYRGWRLVARGSGVILREAGVAVTNNHVVDGATRVKAVLMDGRELDARVVGTDAETDLAVLELPEGEYPALPLVEETPGVGSWVLAFGNPRGLGASVTAGIVSGHGRKGLGIATFESFLQTDASIHAGNSGGPLTDLAAQVVGINTARGLGEEEGINFSIPADIVRDVVEEILTHGRVRRGWLGMRMRLLSSRASANLGLESRRHVAVREALPGGPAEAAGLQAGDVILSMDGESPADDTDFLERVASYDPGDVLQLEVLRDQAVHFFAVELGERPAVPASERDPREVEEFGFEEF